MLAQYTNIYIHEYVHIHVCSNNKDKETSTAEWRGIGEVGGRVVKRAGERKSR